MASMGGATGPEGPVAGPEGPHHRPGPAAATEAPGIDRAILIVYRRLTMKPEVAQASNEASNEAPNAAPLEALTEDRAEEYARWFRCLADPTRLLILNTVARSPEPLTVGRITELVGRSQSTVSKHLQRLAADCFVHTAIDGNRTLVRVNPACMAELPRAATEIMAAPPTPRPPTVQEDTP